MIFTFDMGAYPFAGLVLDCVRAAIAKLRPDAGLPADLTRLHEAVGRSELGAVAAAIYDLFLAEPFIEPYDRLCREIIRERLGGADYRWQRIPSVRIQIPGEISVNYHTDEWYGHGRDVQNFWLPLVPVQGTNSMFVADEIASAAITGALRAGRKSIAEMNAVARRSCTPLTMRYGEIFQFNARIVHGTEINETDCTRVSFDFRMVREGGDRGLKDASFFTGPGPRTSAGTLGFGMIYYGRQEGLISQKYQQLLCHRYAAESGIAVQAAETELTGFDHHPVLWSLLERRHAMPVAHLILFSLRLLPPEASARERFLAAASARGLTLHFVAEDVLFAPGRAADAERAFAALRDRS